MVVPVARMSTRPIFNNKRILNRLRNWNRIPFRSKLFKCLITKTFYSLLIITWKFSAFALNLGPTNSWSTTVHTKPFSTSVLQGLIRLFATTTKICTNGGSMQAYAKHFHAHHCTLLLTKVSKFINPTEIEHKPFTLAVMYRYTT